MNSILLLSKFRTTGWCDGLFLRPRLVNTDEGYVSNDNFCVLKEIQPWQNVILRKWKVK